MNHRNASGPSVVFLAGVLVNWISLFLFAYRVTSPATLDALLALGTVLMFGAALRRQARS